MIIVFSGYNNRAVIAFLRVLERNSLQYSIIASGNHDFLFFTNYSRHIKAVRQNKDLNLDEMISLISNIKSIEQSVLIAPTNEYLNRFCLKYREELSKLNCYIPLVDSDIYSIVSDKYSFAQLCKKHGICIPEDISDFSNIDRIVVKPKTYISSDNHIYSPFVINSSLEYETFISSHDQNDFIFQEYIPGGESIYLLLYVMRNGEIYSFSQKNLCQQAGGKSITSACGSNYHLSEDNVSKYVDILKDIGFHGLIMIEIRLYNGKEFMIEANPRFWGPSQLFVDAHKNFFECLLYEYGYIEKINDFLNDDPGFITYYWNGGMGDQNFPNEKLKWHSDGKNIFMNNINDFMENEIYKRNDTMDIYYIEKLKNLYLQSSKHSQYQSLPHSLMKYFASQDLPIHSRFEDERSKYIYSNIDVKNKKVLDIGGNTGFFTFSSYDLGASEVDYYEGNKTHAEFVRVASDLIKASKINVFPEYYRFDKNNKTIYDVVFNLNVLHHLGDDFGVEKNIDNAKKSIIQYLNNMSYYARLMVFQMGFNWMGNRNLCLFDRGLKKEMIDFIKEGCNTNWNIVSIGIAEKDSDQHVIYNNINSSNILRNDSYGEFLNRPIFIMKSRNLL